MDQPDLFGDDVRLDMLDEFQGLPLQRQCSVDSNNAQRLQLPKNPNEDQIKMKPDPDIGDLLLVKMQKKLQPVVRMTFSMLMANSLSVKRNWTASTAVEE